MNFYKNNHGFTMIEAIVILMIIGIITLIAVSSSRIDTTLKGEAEILKSHIAYVQSLALSNDVHIWGILFEANSYSLLKDDGSVPLNLTPATIHLPDEASNTHSFPSDVSITSGSGTLTFDRWGVPDPSLDYVVMLNGSEKITIRKKTGFVLHEN